MEEPTHDTASLSFDIFDRWGNLKSVYQKHPVKKGSGVWGPELNRGRILLIEEISVEESQQRQGFGGKAFNEVWKWAQTLTAREDAECIAARKKNDTYLRERTRDPSDPEKKQSDDLSESLDRVFGRNEQPVSFGCAFAMVRATVINTEKVQEETKKLPQPEMEAYYAKKQQALEDFWRALGFRRIGTSPYFCYARDPTHPSRLLSAESDYRRPEGSRFDASLELDQEIPYNEELISASDADTRSFLEERLKIHATNDSVWLSTDRGGNNILHTVARDYKPETIAWLLAKSFADHLRSARNAERETPLEVLEVRLEERRTFRWHQAMQVVMCDLFSGYTPTQVACLSQLQGLANPTASEKARLTFGCTCGQCIGGFISPRTSFALECQGVIHNDILMATFGTKNISGKEWCQRREEMLEYLPAGVKRNMETNKSLRKGFTNIFGYIVEALRAKQFPTTCNVLSFADGEWPPCTKNYLNRGGDISAVVAACFDYAINQDFYLGDGFHEVCFHDQIEKLPTCRNDCEFVFARRQLRKLEGLPDVIDPRVYINRPDAGLMSLLRTSSLDENTLLSL